ncbi:MAG: DNA replication complex subunit Gins51 [Candidatus Nezhaarchaeales archaeon]
MNYVKVVFLKEVGAFVGSDGKIYGPYSPGDEAIIPEEDAKALSLEGAAARIGGYIIERGKPPMPIPHERSSPFKTILSSPLLLLWVGFVLIVIGFIIMSFSAISPQGFIWIFPLPPISVSGPEVILLAVLPIAIVLIMFIVFLYLMSRY